ncbi:peptidoglycan-binding protein [Streptomyces afghaniensis]|uniref:peptidoglycan-binding protein n=1 Tax=Streptomyces afghaniensis TaxID=66865 RepID=UPI0037BABA85
MRSPVFEEFDPGSDCDCPGCVHWRRVLPHSRAGRTTAHPAAHRALALAAVASAALGAGHAVPAAAAPHAPHRPGVSAGDEHDTPQGGQAPLYGPGGRPAVPSATLKPAAITRTEIINRAKTWVAAKVPYSMNGYWSDGYRQDCSGYVSMAWKLPGNEWTGSLAQYGERISKEELQPGDILLFHNTADPESGSHVVIFGGWKNRTHTYYTAYEQTRPHTRRKSTPYAYWNDSDRYVPYRYKGVTAEAPATEPGTVPGKEPVSGGAPTATPYPGAAYSGPGAHSAYVTLHGLTLLGDEDVQAGAAGPSPSSHGVPGYPGRAMFRPGADNAHVTRLGRQLVRKGFGGFYPAGPGPRWGEADRRAVEAFQRTQGWRGGAADGYPGPETWRRLFS